MEANTIAINPLHTHDCARCVFLGSHEHDGQIYDLYFCGKHEDGTVIARFGSDGPEYCSGLVFAERGIEPYAEALKRAVAQGVYNPEAQPLRWPTTGVVDVVGLHQQLIGALAHVWLLSGEQKELWIHQLNQTRREESDLSEVIAALISYIESQK